MSTNLIQDNRECLIDWCNRVAVRDDMLYVTESLLNVMYTLSPYTGLSFAGCADRIFTNRLGAQFLGDVYCTPTILDGAELVYNMPPMNAQWRSDYALFSAKYLDPLTASFVSRLGIVPPIDTATYDNLKTAATRKSDAWYSEAKLAEAKSELGAGGELDVTKLDMSRVEEYLNGDITREQLLQGTWSADDAT